MRPRDFSRGNGASAVVQALTGRASMRPRDFSRGNWALTRTRAPAARCFNEAAGFLPRKPQTDVGVLYERASFNEAAGFLPRKPEDGAK